MPVLSGPHEEEEIEVYDVGDYEYYNFLQPQNTCSVRVIDKTKSSYADMPSTITYRGVTYKVTLLMGCFEDCTNLISSPVLSSNATTLRYCFRRCSSLTTAPATIPDSVVSLRQCFRDCASLTTPPTIPEHGSVGDMDSCFSGCASLTRAPAIPASVETIASCFKGCASLVTPPDLSDATNLANMAYSFYGCVALATAPIVPNGVVAMGGCFYNCVSLETAPVIPASVTSMFQCFYNCTSLSGKVIVHTEGATQNNVEIFTGTTQDIYVINAAGTSAVETFWKGVTAEYSNVHYEADDNPNPSLSMSVTRVDTAVSETPSPTGEYAFIKATAVIYDTYLPDGWSVVYDEDESITKDNVLQSPYWTRTNVGNTYTLKCWFSLGDTSKHTFTLQVSDSIKDANDNVKVIQLSPVITQILSKAYKLVDYYHDPTTQTEGMSIGKFATEANLFDVEMPTLFRDTVSLKDSNSVIRQLFDFVYPVGSYYETSDTSFDPNVTWGGTWVLENAGLFHVSSGGGTINGATADNGKGVKDGGDASVTLTANQSGNQAETLGGGGHSHGTGTSGYSFLVSNGNIAVNSTKRNFPSSGGSYHMVFAYSAVEIGEFANTNSTTHSHSVTAKDAVDAHENRPPFVVVNRWHRTA